MLTGLSRYTRPGSPAIVIALVCAVTAIALAANAAAPDVASPAAWSELEFRVLESNDSHTLVEVLIPAPDLRSVEVDGRVFDAVRVPGASPLGRPGEPLLCVAGTMIAIPPTSGVEMRILEEGHSLVDGVVPLPYRTDDWEPGQPLLMDDEAYSRAGFSLDLAEVGEPAIMRDFRVVPLRVFPLSYDASTGQLRVTRRLLIELDYSSPGRTNIKTTERPASRAFRSLYESSIANYGFVRPRYDDDDRGKYLIIAHSNFYNTILPFAEWKHKRGMEVEVANTSLIGSSSSQIKNYIQTAYDTWTVPPEYVLIVGDTEYIPTSDMDNYYGQLEGGDVIVDVHVGRWSCDNVTECELFMQKTLGYNRNPLMTDLDWFRSGCLIIREDYDSGDWIYFDDVWFAHGLMSREGFAQIDTLFRRNGSDKNDVHAAITDGRSFLTYRGQGVSNWWSPFDCNPSLTNNGYKLPIVMSATCGSGSFDGDGYPCETWTKAGTVAAPKGAVAFSATSIVASHVSEYRSAVYQGFFNALFNLKIYTVGAATTNGKLNLLTLYPSQTYEYEGWNVVGDPELDMWTKIPSYPTITHPPSVPTGTSVLTVNVQDGGSPVQDALVCAWAPGEVYKTAYTDAGGDVSLTINPALAETVWVTVTGHNLHPYEGYAAVTATGPYLAYADHTIDDSNTGNDDGLITPGETVELTVSLENTGPEGATGVTGLLTSSDGYVTLGVVSASYGDIASGATVPNATPYTFTANTDCPNGHEVSLTVQASDSSRLNWNVVVPGVTVVAADLGMTTVVVDDAAPGGDGDGTLEVGETAWLVLTVENTGPIGLLDVAGTLSGTDAYVVVTDPAGEFGDVTGSGGTATASANAFRVSVSPTAPPGHVASLTLTVEGDGDTYTHTEALGFDVTVGGDVSDGPCGPDAYGYYAYDSGDTWTGQAPVYDWAEITTVGTEMTVIDQDAAITTISLPFTFRYYGVDYTQISVCSNGFLALGDSDYRFGDNSRIPNAHGPAAMVAPFWMDLDPTAGGAIFQYYDSANHRWICQFDAVEHYNGGNAETFEVILYDPLYYPTADGNGNIVFQYQTVAFPWNCTVGIENPSQTIGIEYLYNAVYDPAAAALANGQAIKFTTEGPDAPAQWLVIDDSSIDDTGGGDGDGIAEPGEMIEVYVTLENLGGSTATSVTGTLTTSDLDVVINDGSAVFGNISAGATGDNAASPFRVTIDSSPSDSIVELDLHMSSTDSRYDSYDVLTLVIALDETGIEDGVVQSVFALRQNTPNPFRNGTTMAFSLPSPARATIGVYNVAGRKVATVVDRDFPAGSHNVQWNGTDSDGRPVPAGIYFYRIDAGENSSTKKMLVLK
jgi:hypothetical protein